MSTVEQDFNSISNDMEAAAEDASWAEYDRLAEKRAELTAKAQATSDVVAAEAEVRTPSGTPAQQVATMKKNLAAAERQLAALPNPGLPAPNGQPPVGMSTETYNAQNEARRQVVGEVENTRQEIALMEGRLPYVKHSDRQIETASAAVHAEIDDVLRRQKEIGNQPGYIGERRLLELKLEPLTPTLKSLMTEHEVRKSIRIAEMQITELAKTKAKSHRAWALQTWEQKLRNLQAQAEREGYGGLGPEIDLCTKSIRDIKALPDNKIYQSEIDDQRAKLLETAPHIKGAWRR